MRPCERRFGIGDCYDALVLGSRALFRVIGNAVRPAIDARFAERLMLAVTEVNGCEACSYAHTRMALKKGFSKEEVESFLSASDAYVTAEEAQGILFAQHYADTRGRPDRDAYEALVSEYGPGRSRAIAAAIQVMMAGNMVGIPFSAFVARLGGRPYRGSSLPYEIGMQLVTLPLLPVAVVHALVRWVGGKENIRFSNARMPGTARSEGARQPGTSDDAR